MYTNPKRHAARIKRRWLARHRRRELRTFDGLLRVTLRQLAVNLVIDVGAHEGEYATRLRAKVNFKGPIVSFEPQAEAFQVLSKRFAGDLNWRGRREALGDRAGDAELHVFSDGMFSSLHAPAAYGLDRYGFLGTSETESVSIARLDDLAGDLLGSVEEPRVLLKVDTQGHDLAVLAGAHSMLDRAVVAVQAEISVKAIYDGVPEMSETLARLREMGLEIVGLFPIARDRDGLRVMEFDGLFLCNRALGTRG